MLKNINDFYKKKQNKEKIVAITAYDYSFARIVEKAGIDCILVGDSLGMTMLGYKDTISVTMEDMIHHTKAVVRGAPNSFVVVDMPFMSYHISDEEAVRNAGRLIKETGASAVKLEGGSEVISRIKAILAAQIPVMGHIGLTPQSVNVLGGFRVQGKELEKAQNIINDALLLEEAGCFSVVLEAIPEKLASLITSRLSIPTIGIGASVDCDGQILVIQDVLGLYEELVPKFARQFEQIGQKSLLALQKYVQEVREMSFPAKEHTYSISDDVIEKLY